MLFNSINFAFFLPVVLVLYWLLGKKKLVYQNSLLLLASYYFYACWDWRFLFLLMFSTLLDYFTGLQISRASKQKNKKIWFWLSVTVNLGFLGVFKYYNFFIESFTELISQVGLQVNPWSLNVILPVGISFYTFHGLSYLIDIYKNRIEAEKNFIDYSVFVSFFPLLVAGPIERATHLLPQIKSKRSFDYGRSIDGLRQILWGLFKKVVIADLSAETVNAIFSNSTHASGSTLVVGAIFFALQIYCDFSGYSDIALGTARLFGIELLKNFAFPYFSRDIAEFWRRWHISLSTWFRDYLYVPLGGSRGSTWMKVRNTFIIFIVSGFWHGANWTFIVWGLLNALYIMPSILLNSNRTHLDVVAAGKLLPTFKEFFSICLTFGLTVFAWIFFRSESLTSAFSYISNIFSPSLFSVPAEIPPILILWALVFLTVEWIGREGPYAISSIGLNWPTPVRWAGYYSIVLAICYFAGPQQQFIYFQF